MTAKSTEIQILRSLQALREERCKADHAAAIAASRRSDQRLGDVRNRLARANTALDETIGLPDLQLDRLRILAGHVCALAQDVDTCRGESERAQTVQANAGTAHLRAEHQTRSLADSHRRALRHERRKADDLTVREFLSLAAARKGTMR